jgi:hypothetical protein
MVALVGFDIFRLLFSVSFKFLSEAPKTRALQDDEGAD